MRGVTTTGGVAARRVAARPARTRAPIRGCQLRDAAGEVIGFTPSPPGRIPRAFRYEGRIYLRGAGLVFQELDGIHDLESINTPDWTSRDAG